MDLVEYKTLHKPGYKSGKELLELQYRNGLSTVERNPWAKNAYQYLLERCPHLSEEEIVRLFHNRTQSQLELVIGAALFRQYNAFHPNRNSMRAGLKIKPVRRIGLISFESPLVVPTRAPKPVRKAPTPKVQKKPAPKLEKRSVKKVKRTTSRSRPSRSVKAKRRSR